MSRFYLYSFLYQFFLLAIQKAGNQWQGLGFRRVGDTLSWLALLAAILDIIENLLMLQTLNHQYSSSSLELTWYCAATKFLIVFIIIVYLLLSMIAFLFVLKKKHGK